MDKNCMNCTWRFVNLYADGREVNSCGLEPDMRVNAKMHCEEWKQRKNNNGYVSTLQR